MKKEKILFVYTSKSTFVKNDIDILSSQYDVIEHCYAQAKNLSGHFLSQAKLFFWLMKNIWTAEKIFIWFADYHSFLPTVFAKILKKKLFIVIGGYDVCFIPEINYGSFKNPLRAFCTKFSIKYSFKNLAVSKYILNRTIQIVPNLHTVLCYNGVDTGCFNLDENRIRKKILTVGYIDSLQRIKLKGIDTFIQLARKNPQDKFLVVGITKHAQGTLKNVPANMDLIEPTDYSELHKYYEEANIYCQFSMVESFCLTLAESILSGVVPIVFNNGALPEIVGDEKYVVKNEIQLISEKIEKLKNISIAERIENRNRIVENFSLKNRKSTLLKVLRDGF